MQLYFKQSYLVLCLSGNFKKGNENLHKILKESSEARARITMYPHLFFQCHESLQMSGSLLQHAEVIKWKLPSTAL